MDLLTRSGNKGRIGAHVGVCECVRDGGGGSQAHILCEFCPVLPPATVWQGLGGKTSTHIYNKTQKFICLSKTLGKGNRLRAPPSMTLAPLGREPRLQTRLPLLEEAPGRKTYEGPRGHPHSGPQSNVCVAAGEGRTIHFRGAWRSRSTRTLHGAAFHTQPPCSRDCLFPWCAGL